LPITERGCSGKKFGDARIQQGAQRDVDRPPARVAQGEAAPSSVGNRVADLHAGVLLPI
jgi:hypothetical protein